MSKFLIVPRYLYGQLKCCNSNGITDPVTAPVGVSSATYEAVPISLPYHWRLASADGDIGAVGFGVCCAPKTFTVQFTLTANFGGTGDSTQVDFVVDVSGGAPEVDILTVTFTVQRTTMQDWVKQVYYSNVLGPIYEEIVTSPVTEMSHVVELSTTVIPTACRGNFDMVGGIASYGLSAQVDAVVSVV